MNKFQKSSSAITAIVLVIAILISSCKKQFDNPPSQTDPAIVANTTLASLKARHTVSGNFDQITDNAIISGVVIADDKSGNLYKTIYIQDSTGALQINLELSSIYGTFPVGRRVYIKCNGLCLSDYHGTPELGVKSVVNGVPSLNGIPSALVQNYIIGGSINNPVVPIVVTISQLGTGLQDPYMGNLIQLDGYEFQPSDTTHTYGDTSVYKNAGDLYVKNCSSSTLLDVRTSGYASFAGLNPPKGNGSLVAIYTIYKSFPTSIPTKQFLIRDTSDVRFTGIRCGGSTGGGGGGTSLLSENFESQTANTAIAITGWTNAAEVGGILYQAKTFSSNKYASISAFGTNVPTVTSWLVTKAINLGSFTTKTLTFKTNQGFTGTSNALAAPLKIMVSTNYTGNPTPWTATWTDISSQATLSPGLATGYPTSFTSSGNINLNSYTGTIYISFVYYGADPTGTASDKTSTWEIDDVTVTGN